MHRFFVPNLASGEAVQLPDDEAQHLARVLRLKPGDPVAVFDGKGVEAIAQVESVSARRVTVRVIQPRSAAPEPAVAITLAQALLKSDKMDRVVRDAVMLGVTAIQPFVSQRTDVPRAALQSGVRQDRWERTVISSVKQCGRAVVPPVLETLEFGQLIRSSGEQRSGAGQAGARRGPASGAIASGVQGSPRVGDRMKVMFVEPGAGAGRVDDLTALEGRRPSEAMILIGPEGGWDPQEVDAAEAAGVKLVRFGKRTLRADAAAAAAIAVLQYIWKDL